MKKPLWIFVVLAVLSGCSSVKQGLGTSKQRIAHDISRARSLYEMGEVEAAIANLTQMVDASSYNRGQDIAYELIVEWLLQTNNYAEAKRYASYFLSHHPKSPSSKKVAALFNSLAVREKYDDTSLEVEPGERAAEPEIELELEKKKLSFTNSSRES